MPRCRSNPMVVAIVARVATWIGTSIPATIEGTVNPVISNGTTTGNSATTPEPAPAPKETVPSKEDPLADLEMLDDEVFSGRTTSTS